MSIRGRYSQWPVGILEGVQDFQIERERVSKTFEQAYRRTIAAGLWRPSEAWNGLWHHVRWPFVVAQRDLPPFRCLGVVLLPWQ